MEYLKHSTVMRRSAAVRHLNGVNVLDGLMSLSDDQGRGGSQPTTVIPVNIQRVDCLTLDNRRITCREIAQETNL